MSARPRGMLCLLMAIPLLLHQPLQLQPRQPPQPPQRRRSKRLSRRRPRLMQPVCNRLDTSTTDKTPMPATPLTPAMATVILDTAPATVMLKRQITGTNRSESDSHSRPGVERRSWKASRAPPFFPTAPRRAGEPGVLHRRRTSVLPRRFCLTGQLLLPIPHLFYGFSGGHTGRWRECLSVRASGACSGR
jgi:hypothetical protein